MERSPNAVFTVVVFSARIMTRIFIFYFWTFARQVQSNIGLNYSLLLILEMDWHIIKSSLCPQTQIQISCKTKCLPRTSDELDRSSHDAYPEICFVVSFSVRICLCLFWLMIAPSFGCKSQLYIDLTCYEFLPNACLATWQTKAMCHTGRESLAPNKSKHWVVPWRKTFPPMTQWFVHDEELLKN